MFDDYTEIKTGAASRLEKTLRQYFEGTVMNDLDSVKHSPRRRFTTAAIEWLKSIRLPNKRQSSKLPRHRSSRQRSTSQVGVCPILPASLAGDHNFVLLCVPFMRTAKLHQPEVCRINSDREFFRVLRYYYASERKTSPWIHLRTVRAIKFVKVGRGPYDAILRDNGFNARQLETYRSLLVDVQESPSIPPDNQVGHEYSNDPLPAETNPPIGPNLLMHLFEHPEDADVLPVLFRKIPKKLRSKLEPCPVKGSAVGWGVQFVEGMNWFVIFICGCVGFAWALIFAVAWSTVRGDIQGGFSIAGFMLAFLGFCLGVARMEDPLALY